MQVTDKKDPSLKCIGLGLGLIMLMGTLKPNHSLLFSVQLWVRAKAQCRQKYTTRNVVNFCQFYEMSFTDNPFSIGNAG